LISASGVKISPRKLKVIEAIPPPKSRKSLLRILGMANFWKKNYKELQPKYLPYASITEKKTLILDGLLNASPNSIF